MTHLGASLVITGELASDEDLVIDGRVNGHILVRGAALTIGDGGAVEADARGARVLIRGTLKGSITATERIELAPQASVLGSLSADRVVIADGARFDGRIDMNRRTIAAKMAQHRTDNAAAR